MAWTVLLGFGGAADAQLLVLSQESNQVLEYDAIDGSFVGVFADTVTVGFRNPVALAMRATDGRFYLPSAATGELWSYTAATAAPVTPPLATGLFSPTGAAFDAAEAFLYFADQSAVEVELVDSVLRYEVATGNVTLVGTNSSADLQGLAVNGSDVFATDLENDRVLRFPVAGGSGVAVVSTGLADPVDLLFPTPTLMLVADTGNDRVVEYALVSGSWVFQREVLPAAAGVVEPCGLALAPDGRLSVAGRVSNDVVLVDLATLAVTPLVAPGAGGLSGPGSLAWDGSTLLVASVLGNAILYYDATGSPTGLRAEGIGSPLDGGIELSPDALRLLVGTSSGNAVIEYDVASGAPLRTFVGACPTFPGLFDVALGPGGDVYVSCNLANGIHRFDGASGAALGFFVIGTGGLSNPRGLAFGPNGNLFVANGGTGEILEYDGTSGSFVGVFVDAGGNGGGPVDPWGLQFHQGALYAASRFPNEVKAFDATTGAFLSTFVTSGSGGLSEPTALGFGPGGDLYVTSRADDAIRRYAGGTGAFVEVFVPTGSGGLDAPFDLVFVAAPPVVPVAEAAGRALLVATLAALGAGRLQRRRRSARIPR